MAAASESPSSGSRPSIDVHKADLSDLQPGLQPYRLKHASLKGWIDLETPRRPIPRVRRLAAVAFPQAVATFAGYRRIVVSVSASNSVGRDGLPSSTEQIAAALPDARVVNAFTLVWSNVVRDPGAGQKNSVFVRSNDEHGIKNAGLTPATYFVVAIGPGAA